MPVAKNKVDVKDTVALIKKNKETVKYLKMGR
jgi:hypothetical protein